MRKQLAQIRPGDTLAATALQESAPWEVDLILVSNTTGTAAVFSIYHDADGTTYSEATSLFFESPIEANDVAYIELQDGIANVNRLGSIGVKSGTTSAGTFTLYGTLAGDRT